MAEHAIASRLWCRASYRGGFLFYVSVGGFTHELVLVAITSSRLRSGKQLVNEPVLVLHSHQLDNQIHNIAIRRTKAT